MSRLKKFVACVLFPFALMGCGTLRDGYSLPKERFLREQNSETRTYQLWETSPEAERRKVMEVMAQGMVAYNTIRADFPDNKELDEYVEEELLSIEVRRVLGEEIVEQMESKMGPGDTLYLFELREQSDRSKNPVYGDDSLTQMRKASGMLILNRKGKLVWREIEEANYPYYKEEAQYEELNRVLSR